MRGNKKTNNSMTIELKQSKHIICLCLGENATAKQLNMLVPRAAEHLHYKLQWIRI